MLFTPYLSRIPEFWWNYNQNKMIFVLILSAITAHLSLFLFLTYFLCCDVWGLSSLWRVLSFLWQNHSMCRWIWHLQQLMGTFSLFQIPHFRLLLIDMVSYFGHVFKNLQNLSTSESHCLSTKLFSLKKNLFLTSEKWIMKENSCSVWYLQQ